MDAQTRRVLQDELLRTWREHRKLVVYVTHDIQEAVRLGERVLVMTGRPGRVREEIPIPRERAGHDDWESPELAEIRWRIWKLLESEVRRSLNAIA